MTESEKANRLQHPKGGEPRAKKPYVKPEFRHEKVFETMALTCGKVQSTQSSCHASHKTS